MHPILPRWQSRHLDTKRLILLLEQRPDLPLDVTTHRDSYAFNYRELTLSESLAEDGFKPLTVESMRKNLTTELISTSMDTNFLHVHVPIAVIFTI